MNETGLLHRNMRRGPISLIREESIKAMGGELNDPRLRA
jgi:hypothetical protein